jgi:hypothetical protein
MRQQDNEPLAEYYKRFTSYVDVLESQWGTLVPTAAVTNEMNEKTSRDKSITCHQAFQPVDTTKQPSRRYTLGPLPAYQDS